MKRQILQSAVVGCLWMTGCSTQREAGTPVDVAWIKPEMQACAERALRNGPDPSDLPLAFTRFTEGCDRGDPAACSLLGVMYERGMAIPASPRRARSYFARSCSLGNHFGCSNLLENAGLAPLPPPLPMPLSPARTARR